MKWWNTIFSIPIVLYSFLYLVYVPQFEIILFGDDLILPKKPWLLSKVVRWFCARTSFLLPCVCAYVCLFLKKNLLKKKKKTQRRRHQYNFKCLIFFFSLFYFLFFDNSIITKWRFELWTSLLVIWIRVHLATD